MVCRSLSRQVVLPVIAASVLLSAAAQAEPETKSIRGVRIVARDEASGQLQPVELYGKMLALVVGIDQYADPNHNLKYAVSDAEAVAKALETEFAFSQVLKLYNDQATRAGIVGKITELAKEATGSDAVLIFFAGHGTQIGRKEDAVGYLIPHDGAFAEEQKEWANNISMSTVVSDWSRRIRAKHIFYVMDACYSGLMATRAAGAARTPSRDFVYLKEMTREPVRIVLTAGQAGQRVLDGGNEQGHSVFTARLLEALRSRRDFVTALEVAAELKRKVSADADARTHTQTPDYARLSGLGDFVFVPREESLESLQTRLNDLEASLLKMTEVQKAAARKEKAELEAQLAAARKREELRRHAERDATRIAEEAAKRRKDAEEMQRKIAEAEAREAAARAKYMTIAAARSEAQNILELMETTTAHVDADYAAQLAKLSAPKDMFEKTAAYNARQARLRKLRDEEIPAEKQRRLKGFVDALEILDGKEFLVDRAEVRLAFKTYDADRELFEIELGRESRPPRPLYMPIPPSEAKPMYRAWENETLLSRAYARLEALKRSETRYDIKDEVSRIQFTVPGRDEPYELHTSMVIVVETNPAGAAVSVEPPSPIDNRQSTIGNLKSPCRIEVEEPGTYIVSVSLKGHRTVSRAVAVKGSGLFWVDVTLEKWGLPSGPGEAFEVPAEARDQHGNPICKGADKGTSLPLEIRHKSTGMHFVFILPGSFQMGSNDGSDGEKPVHKVTLTKPFYLGKYEVTQAEWEKVIGKNPSDFRGDQNPVERVSWNDCQEFLKKLNSQFRIPNPQFRFSLPTEAQWEYACRAGSTTQFCFGSSERGLGDYAWYDENSGVRKTIAKRKRAIFGRKVETEKSVKQTHLVGDKKPNAWGLYDMHGNVWEWCQDWKDGDDDYYEQSPEADPAGPKDGRCRVLRGGSWNGYVGFCRSASRFSFGPIGCDRDVGFRVSLVIGFSR